MNEEFELLVLEESNVEHRIVNGEDLSDYKDNVKKCYSEARDVLVKGKTAKEQIRNDKALRELLEVVDKNINSENPNLQELQLDKQDV